MATCGSVLTTVARCSRFIRKPYEAIRWTTCKTLDWMPNLLTLNRDTQGRFWFVQDRFGLCLHEPQHGKNRFATPEIQNLTVDARVTVSSPPERRLMGSSSPPQPRTLLTYDQ